MQLHDMGEVSNTDVAQPSEGSPKKEKHYPSVSISSKQMPELKGKKFGDSLEMMVKGKIAGMHEDYDDKTEGMFEIKIMECGMMGKGMDKDEYDKLSEEEKDKADEKDVLEE